MNRTITITSMLLLALIASCREGKPDDQELTRRLVGTWVRENMLAQIRTTYKADGSWRMRAYSIQGATQRESGVKHQLLGAIGKNAATSELSLSSRGTWRIENVRLLLTEDNCPDSQESLDGLTETSWTTSGGPRRYVSIKLQRWESMSDAEILSYHGTITAALADPYEGMFAVDVNDKPRLAYLLAKAYMVYDYHDTARDKFQALLDDFPGDKYAKPSIVHLHICKAGAAVRDRAWSKAGKEYDRAALVARELQDQSDRGTTFHSWAMAIRGYIGELDAERIAKQAFIGKMVKIRELYKAGDNDKTLAMLDDAIEDPETSRFDVKNELQELRNALKKQQSLDECQSLLDKARTADADKPDEKLAAYDRAQAALVKLRRNIDPDQWKSMMSEVLTGRQRLTRMAAVQGIMSTIEKARNSGDGARLSRTLEHVLEQEKGKSNLPPKLVEIWTKEIKTIREQQEYARIIGLLSAARDPEAIEAMNAFVKKYPKNKRARVILEVLKQKMTILALRKEAEALFNQKKWAEALVKLEELKRHTSRRGPPSDTGIRHCKYELELIRFKETRKAGNLQATLESSQKLKKIWPARHEREITPMISDSLTDAAEALKKGEYARVPQILRGVDSPEAGEMIRRSRYLQTLTKGDAAKKEGDAKTAIAMYKIAKRYAKGSAEHKRVDALISAVADER